MEAARAAIAKDKGDAALEPWSLSYSIAGDTEKALDPYFAFENAVDVWARTFAGLGIKCPPPASSRHQAPRPAAPSSSHRAPADVQTAFQLSNVCRAAKSAAYFLAANIAAGQNVFENIAKFCRSC